MLGEFFGVMRDPFSLKIEPGTQDGPRVPPDPQKSPKIVKNDAQRAEKHTHTNKRNHALS